MQNLCIGHECTSLEYPSCENGFATMGSIILPWTENVIWECVLEHFVNLLHVKRNQTCISGINALFRGTKVAKIVSHQMHPFLSLGPIKMFVCVLEHFRNLQNVK
jgi:hypothetical protein